MIFHQYGLLAFTESVTAYLLNTVSSVYDYQVKHRQIHNSNWLFNTVITVTSEIRTERIRKFKKCIDHRFTWFQILKNKIVYNGMLKPQGLSLALIHQYHMIGDL